MRSGSILLKTLYFCDFSRGGGGSGGSTHGAHSVLCFTLEVPWDGLWSVIVACLCHTHLFFVIANSADSDVYKMIHVGIKERILQECSCFIEFIKRVGGKR